MEKALHVLLVDDDEAFRATLRELLISRDHAIRVAEASSGEEALRIAAIGHPDVVLMDLTMPRMNGVEATRQLKTLWPDLPVIILTVHEEPVYERVAMAAGADGYIVKKTAGTALWPALAGIAPRRGGSRPERTMTVSRSPDADVAGDVEGKPPTSKTFAGESRQWPVWRVVPHLA